MSLSSGNPFHISCWQSCIIMTFARPTITILLMILMPPWQSNFSPVRGSVFKEGRCCRPGALTDIYWQDPAFLTFFKLLRQRWYLG